MAKKKTPQREFEVSLPGAKRLRVFASGPESAIHVYMDKLGIVATGQHPEIQEVTTSVEPADLSSLTGQPATPQESQDAERTGNAEDDQAERLPADAPAAGVTA